MGRSRPGLPGRGLYKVLPWTRESPAAETLTLGQPQPQTLAPAASRRRRQPPSPRRRSAGAARRPRFAASKSMPFKKIRSSFFFFVGFFLVYFLMAISDPIFVLV